MFGSQRQRQRKRKRRRHTHRHRHRLRYRFRTSCVVRVIDRRRCMCCMCWRWQWSCVVLLSAAWSIVRLRFVVQSWWTGGHTRGGRTVLALLAGSKHVRTSMLVVVSTLLSLPCVCVLSSLSCCLYSVSLWLVLSPLLSASSTKGIDAKPIVLSHSIRLQTLLVGRTLLDALEHHRSLLL